MSHWAEKYIGEPWVAGENDCWAFARKVWREQFGVEVPVLDVDACNRLACSRAFATHAEKDAWRRVETPMDGDAALIGQSERPSHVGVFAEGGVLHCVQGAGVVFASLPALVSSGWRVLGWYRRGG